MKVLEFNYRGLLCLRVGQEHKRSHLPMGDYEKLGHAEVQPLEGVNEGSSACRGARSTSGNTCYEKLTSHAEEQDLEGMKV